MNRLIVTGAAIVSALAATLFLAPQADAGLVEDLRSGKSNVRAVSQVGPVMGLLKSVNDMRPKQDFKAIAYSGMYTRTTQGVYGAYSAEQAIETALEMCEKAVGNSCFIYAVGDQVVTGYTQKELADEIEAYDPRYRKSAASANPDTLSGRSYCMRADGSVYITWGKCVETTAITKAEYARLKKQAAEKNLLYCQRQDGFVFKSGASCGGAAKITKAEYDRHKNAATGQKSAASRKSKLSTGIKYCGREDGSVFRAWDNCGKARQITDFEYYDEVEARTANIKTWLKSIGLERYEPEFRRNDITLDIISELTDSDLKEIGIKSLGARKRILKAAK